MNQTFNKLVEKAYERVAFFNTPGGKIGEWIFNLTPEERDELRNLTSKDTDHRLSAIHGIYPLMPNWNKDYKNKP